MVIKTLTSQNPLSDCGRIVTGKRFVGRSKELSTLKNRTLLNNSGNIAIMGLPRSGKTSLAWNALMEEEYEKFIILYINVGSIENADEFFYMLISEVLDEIEMLDIFNEKQMNYFEKIKNEILNTAYYADKKVNISKFFKMFSKKSEYRIIYILDEFDHIGTIFKLENFQFLRELASSPQIKISLVTISRRTIEEIELLNNEALSKFATIFSYLHLGLFNIDEVKEYWQRLKEFGIETDSEYREVVEYYAGNFPYLIDLFNYETINEILYENNLDIAQIIKNKIQLNFYQHYDHIINLLKEERLYDKLIQLLVGPVFNLSQKDIEKLEKFGIISKTEDGYKTFSEFFYEYLQLKSDSLDYWPLWSQTEKKLRDLVKDYLEKNYSQNWEDEIKRKYPKIARKIDRLNEMREKNIKNFKEKASKHLVDYTYPWDIYSIFIANDWNYFQKVFRESLREWEKIFSHLAKVRNPIAHSNTLFVSENDKNLAIAYCEKIITIIDKHLYR